MSYFKASLYALLTAPLILFNVSHASLYTTGDLEYDDVTGVITNQLTRQTYLGWDMISSYTYQETVDATASGGFYSDYHIANFDEAKTFFEAAMDGTCQVASTSPTTNCNTSNPYAPSPDFIGFGDNYGIGRSFDAIFFLTDAAVDKVGQILMIEGITDAHQLTHSYGTVAQADLHASGGRLQGYPAGWLLVANTTSAVPVPAAIWLFGTALIGLVGYGKRKSKVPV